MSRPVGSGSDLRKRRAEWSLVRRTATLGDIVDEATFASMLGVTKKALRQFRHRGSIHGVVVPEPIARPENDKPIWLKAEADAFARSYFGARKARRK